MASQNNNGDDAHNPRQEEARVIDFTRIGNGPKRTRVEMQGSSNHEALLSNSTIQRDERERLLRQQETEGATADGIEEDELDLQEEGHRVQIHDRRAEEDEVKPHWLWGNWIALATAACIMFAVCNFFIGEISDMGASALEYFCSGSLLVSIVYFVSKREWGRLNVEQRGILDQAGRDKKVLLRTWDNRFDWWSLFMCFVGAAFQTAIFLSIVLTFKVARMAGLNIGIAQSIWAINPFMISILERFVYNVEFKFKQMYGMLCMVLCAVCVSLSNVITPTEDDSPATILPTPSPSGGGGGGQVQPVPVMPDEELTPVWMAVIASFLMPVVCTFFVIVIKHVNETLNMDSRDFSTAYWGIASLAWQIAGFVAFAQDDFVFEWSKWINGFFASAFNLAGCLFAIACFSTGAPIGPASALISCQTILVVAIVAISSQTVPSAMELIGLAIGLLGAMLLTIPDQLYALYYRLTRCRPLPRAAQQTPATETQGKAVVPKHEDL